MCKLIYILILAMFFPVTGWSENKSLLTHSKYFYTVAQTESYDWVYQLPSCAQLPEKKYATFKKAKKCQKLDKNRQSCETNETASLTNNVSGKKQTFKLNYIVFNSLLECQNDRESYLQGN